MDDEQVTNTGISTEQAHSVLGRLSLPDIVSAAKLAEHLGLPALLIRKNLASGAIPARQIGGEWFTTRRALLEWMEGGEPQP